MTTETTGQQREGVLAAVAAYVMWGFMPLYLLLLATVSSSEILLHRIIWSVPFGALIIASRHQWSDVRAVFRSWRTLAWLALAATFIGVNWLVYIIAVQQAQIFQASLGYYINPLLYVLVGVVFFGERLRVAQLIAVALATIGVMVLTVSGGEFPWISLILAISFSIYGVIRKQVVIGAMPGLFVETLLLLPLALAWFGWLMQQGESVFLSAPAGLQFLLVVAGPVTVLPLLGFALAARRLRLSTIGFLQYIGPTLQFLIGWWSGETLTAPRIVCFLFIWVAVIVFCADSLRSGRREKHD